MSLKRLLAILAFAILCAPCFAQQYTPTKAQYDKLKKARAKVIAVQEKIQEFQNDVPFLIAQASEECRKIAQQNRWPEGVTCNLQTLVFTAPVKPPEPPPAAPEAKKKP
ncbi:MAG TPA: hypothetical protein VGT24_01500 [Candidatus Acidoferrales bacterium]|nr:hypothetical protein [Candidatus Acidoferrales bacterium]